MKLKTALAPIVALLSVAFVASDASAYYASHMGRWLTRDPIGYEGSQWNLYEYVDGRPVTDRDPAGLYGGWTGWGPGGGGMSNLGQLCADDGCPPGESLKSVYEAEYGGSLSACATAKWSLYRDNACGVLGFLAGTCIGGAIGGGGAVPGGAMGAALGESAFPTALCLEKKCYPD
jgi:hypothetical protein